MCRGFSTKSRGNGRSARRGKCDWEEEWTVGSGDAGAPAGSAGGERGAGGERVRGRDHGAAGVDLQAGERKPGGDLHAGHSDSGLGSRAAEVHCVQAVSGADGGAVLESES